MSGSDDDHRLDPVRVWLAGPAPTDVRRTVEPELPAGHWSRFWRCRACGRERERPAEFRWPCSGGSGGGEPALADD